ncbi:hypothetical protein J14TS5_10660 [Paenibacillus lautus]|uniref:hypothetical protein n=1 Tax=Paenibacillus lautus TaxID=1401 RepID=UPI001B239A1E|nr:hypothetical protein [Paenibacillus lautus]GIO95980.1 hypothetical protein J14TS5_10660 [Paenibacillus lautus]
MDRKPVFIIFVILCLLISVSCSNNREVTTDDIDNIKLELVEQREEANGKVFTLKLHNKSSHIIVQNNVYLSFPIKIENGAKGNDFKIEARNNKLNINPEEELLLTVFAPKEMYEGNHNIDLEDPHIEIKGFFNEVTEINQFNMIGRHRTMDS